MSSQINQELQDVITKYAGGNSDRFAKSLGINHAQLNGVLTGSLRLTADMRQAIEARYPGAFSGEGE